MRADVVVNLAPAIEGCLGGGEVSEAVPVQHLGLQAAMEALLLALGLRVVGSPVCERHVEIEQPHGQPGMLLAAARSPGRAVVRQHAPRQSVAPEHAFQPLTYRLGALVAARAQFQRITRMVVEDGQRMAASLAKREMALEIHLPQIVRPGVLEADMVPRLPGARAVQRAVASQDRGDRGGRRNIRHVPHLQDAPDLAATPGRILAPHPQHLRLHRFGGPGRAGQRTPRPIGQPAIAVSAKANYPLIPRLRADPETPTKLPLVRIRHRSQATKLLAFRH